MGRRTLALAFPPGGRPGPPLRPLFPFPHKSAHTPPKKQFFFLAPGPGANLLWSFAALRLRNFDLLGLLPRGPGRAGTPLDQNHSAYFASF